MPGSEAASIKADTRQILVKCACGEEAYVNPRFAGKRGKCKVCGEEVVVPDTSELATSPAK